MARMLLALAALGLAGCGATIDGVYQLYPSCGDLYREHPELWNRRFCHRAPSAEVTAQRDARIQAQTDTMRAVSTAIRTTPPPAPQKD